MASLFCRSPTPNISSRMVPSSPVPPSQATQGSSPNVLSTVSTPQHSPPGSPPTMPAALTINAFTPPSLSRRLSLSCPDLHGLAVQEADGLCISDKASGTVTPAVFPDKKSGAMTPPAVSPDMPRGEFKIPLSARNDRRKRKPGLVIPQPEDPEKFRGWSTEDYARYALIRGSAAYKDPGEGNTFRVRGVGYAKDQKKVSAGRPLGQLLLGQVFSVDPNEPNRREDCMASRGKLKGYVDEMQALDAGNGEPPFLFIIVFQVPGSPPLSLLFVFALRPQQRQAEDLAAWCLFDRFVDLTESQKIEEPAGENGQPLQRSAGELSPLAFQNQRFKLITSIVEGPAMVKWIVGTKPTCLGQKLTQRYFRGPNWLELDIDVASSVVASQTTGLCRGYAKHIGVDLGILVQGEDEAKELPEKLIGVVGIEFLDLTDYEHNPESVNTK